LTRALATHRCCTAALCQLPGLIPEIRSFKCGPDVGVNPGNWDFAVAAEFDSIDDQTVYRDHRSTSA
jgi:hypothetical protein